MKCLEIQELLSAYHDRMLPDSSSASVDKHLTECPSCAEERVRFQELSALAESSKTPMPPKQIWERIEQQLVDQQLDQQPESKPLVKESQDKKLSLSKQFLLAATLLMTVGIGWFGYQSWYGSHYHHDDNFAVEFKNYLKEFRRNPDAAQQILLAKYESHPVSPEQAIQRIGYRPAIADGLPEGYRLVSTHVMKMPCCHCMQSLCKRSDGSTLVIFEHGGERCRNHECCMVEIDDQIATTWKFGTRHMTLIGVQNDSEIKQMTTWLSRKKIRTQEE